MSFRWVSIWFLCALLWACTPASTEVREPALTPTAIPPTPTAALITPTPPPLDATLRQQIFTEVWTTINEHYLDPTFNGVDWARVRAEYGARALAAEDDAAFFAVISAMVRLLRDDHSRFVPPQAVIAEDQLTTGREEQVGIGVSTLPLSDGLLIQHVFPDSPAARAGLQPRDRIVAIDGLAFNLGSIEGPLGSSVRLLIVQPEGVSRELELIRERVEGRIEPLIRRLSDDVAYVGISTLWVNDMHEQVATALQRLMAERPLRGVILDLRSNPGGWRDVLSGLLGHFVTGDVGAFISRKGVTPLVVTVRNPDLRGLPLAILVDRGTASYAELLAAVLQQEAQATVIGRPSAGNTETIYAYEITGGARLWVAQEVFRLNDGSDLEGKGVQPDIQPSSDWTRFRFEADPWITLALDRIRESR
ncbi:S41 family peptidase [Chloroflexus aurantiacus]|nr:MAG: peptidase S41 [Chloroflexus sp.]